jgi:putative SOS response-associated peptidase YedK
MCYSALVRQDLQWLTKRYGAEIAWEIFEELFLRRLDDPDVKLCRALDVFVMRMEDERALKSQTYIEQYRVQQAHAWEQELFEQRTRLTTAQRKLAKKETKEARKNERIATDKIATLSTKLTTLRSDGVDTRDTRIFRMTYAPVIVGEGERRMIRPMRYLCRLPGTPPGFDEKYPGIYNARRDSLNAFWAPLYKRNHGLLVADCFFEKVERHVYERRELMAGERPSFFDLRFDPNSGEPMTIACVWAHWTGEGGPVLDSFAAITDDPPPEVLATGHTRCVIPVKEENVKEWLSPGKVGERRLEEILSERGVPYFEHRIAA